MAGSRLHKIGTIFSRTSGLIKSGALRTTDKPIWFDIYEAFPPKIEPKYDRPEPNNEIRNILYEEDVIRAKFFNKFGSVGFINLSEKNNQKSIGQLFVEEYMLRKSNTCLSEEELIEEVAAYLETKGIHLRGKAAVSKEADDSESSLKSPFKLSGLFTQEKQ